MTRLIALATLLAAQALATQSFNFSYGGRTYTITTQGLGHVFTWNSSYWVYEPSVVLPSPQTNYQYVLIFSSGTGFRAEAIYATTSYSAAGPFPSPPAKVLSITDTGNLCDMIDARPYWDAGASIFHVYVQAIEGTAQSCPTQGTDAGVYEATGPSLGQLSWVYDAPQQKHAQRITAPYSNGGPVGIGEVIQWYNSVGSGPSGFYGGASWVPFVTTFNDWSYAGQDCQPTNPNGAYVCQQYCPLCTIPYNGTEVISYAGPNGTSPMYFWYYQQAPWTGPTYLPDVILAGSLDSQTAGNPALGFNDNNGSSYGAAFFPDPVPYMNGIYLPYNGGFYFPGPLESASGVMSSPRVARNPYGYLDAVPGSYPRTWQTYLYYVDCTSNKGCGLGVSSLTITQQ
ncbi:MAG TPA: hypothetical protein VKF41_07785 [Bryobacteraceae bacterium]|nr:hypothetical protein [Bryobacteraceae bacterium]